MPDPAPPTPEAHSATATDPALSGPASPTFTVRAGADGAAAPAAAENAGAAGGGGGEEGVEGAERLRRRGRLKAAALGGALVGMVLGAVVEMFVQGAMESTGYFGPTLDSLIAKQESNFDDLRSKLEALAASTDPAEQKRLRGEVAALMADQEKLAARTAAEMREYQKQIESLRAQVLARGGGVGGADFWVALGESVAVGDRGNVLGILSVPSNSRGVQVNFGGKRHALNPGDGLDVPVAGQTGRLIFKQRSDDGRAGFDYVPPAE